MSIFTKNRPPVPAVWRHVDALTDPGRDAAPAARLHHAALKLLRTLSHLAGRRVDQPSTSTFSFDSLWWTDAKHFAQQLALAPYAEVGPAHVDVQALHLEVFGGTHTWAEGFDASMPHTTEEFADAMVPVPPSEVPTEPELRSMAEACVTEFGGHWDRLGPTAADTQHMQTILKLVGAQGCTESKLAEGLFKQNWGGSRNRAGNYRLTPGARKLVNAMIPRILRRTGAGGHSRYVLGCTPAGVPAEVRVQWWPRQE